MLLSACALLSAAGAARADSELEALKLRLRRARTVEAELGPHLVKARDPKLREAPAGQAERAFARRLSDKLGVALEGVRRVQQPAVKRARAGRLLQAEAEELLLGPGEGSLLVRHARFKTREDAAAFRASHLAEELAHTSKREPWRVTWLRGSAATRALLSKLAPHCARGLPADLASKAGLALRVRETFTLRFLVPPSVPPARGTRVLLRKGPAVVRLRFANAAAAGSYLYHHVLATRSRRLVDQRGAELVLLDRVGKSAPARVGSLLRHAWGAGAEPAARTTLLIQAPRGREQAWAARTFLTYVRRGEVYEAATNPILSARRQGGEVSPKGRIRWRFSDGAAKNDLVYRGPKLYCEALLTLKECVWIATFGLEEHRREKAYLLALLKGLGIRAPLRARLPIPIE